MWCAVCNCANNNETLENIDEKLSFHRFPTDPSLRKVWLFFCKRNDKFNMKTARICGAHFVKEDYNNYLQHQMGLAHCLILKKGAIPSIYTIKSDGLKDQTSRSDRMAAKAKKEIISSLLVETVVSSDSLEVADECTTINSKELLEKLQNLHLELADIKTKMEIMKYENDSLKEAEEKYKDEIVTLKLTIKKSEFHRVNMETKLLEIFTPGQVRKIEIGSKRLVWTKAWYQEIVGSKRLVWRRLGIKK